MKRIKTHLIRSQKPLIWLMGFSVFYESLKKTQTRLYASMLLL